MEKPMIALQLYSVREELEKDFPGTLKKIKEMGYEGVEFADLHGRKPAELKEMCEQAGLVPISGQIYADVLSDPETVIKEYAKSGISYAVLSLGYDFEKGHFVCDVSKPKAACKAAEKLGLVPLYHNHNGEFRSVNGKIGYHEMFEAIGEELSAEPDLCWVQVAGADPVGHLKRYTGRVPVVHLKDYYLPEGAADVPHYGDVDEDPDSGFEFRPLGKGLADIKAQTDAAMKAGTKVLVVEQDMPTPGMTALECAAESAAYLKKILE